jgi:hypothetical protein
VGEAGSRAGARGASVGATQGNQRGGDALSPGDVVSITSAPTSKLDASAIPLQPFAGIVPGSIVAGRFRIVAPLGRGGMGEVYRADDLRLDQAVALKFLPADHASSSARVERLVREVRLAREVAHPNVCRVYDFVDSGHEQFVTMEYVDGESLGALLQRAGRLPESKALDIAHQVTRALAAVHAKGILHCDLKPDNVMIDGRGQARLLDFGIASLARFDEPTGDPEASFGTPAYMAPEQLQGRPPDLRTDIYALGLLLFELFTGRRPFPAKNRGELIRMQLDEPVPSPLVVAPSLDPNIAGIVQACLDKDPRRRPPSARAVVAALPGLDPLDAALAAGATPDREVVAAADDVGALSRPRAWLAVAGTLVALVLFALLTPQASVVARLKGIERSGRLDERAQAVLLENGWEAREDDVTHSEFETDWSYFHRIAQRDSSARRWDALDRPPSPLLFIWTTETAPKDTPPESSTRSARVVLDHAGRLKDLQASPPLRRLQGSGGTWAPLFRQAGLDFATFSEVESRLPAGRGVDRRLAWEGTFAEAPATLMHVEGGALADRVAYFRVQDAAAVPATVGEAYERRMRFGHELQAGVLIVAIVAGVWLALRNLRAGRGDRQGARRLATAFIATGFAVRLFLGSPIVLFERGLLSAPGLGEILLLGGIVFVMYLATEPYIRRRWPRRLVGWARVLSRRIRDPIVGRDVLLGVLTGLGSSLLLAFIRTRAFGVVMPPLAPFVPNGQALASWGGLVSTIVQYAMEAVAFGLGVLVGLVVLRAITRSENAAIGLALLSVLLPHAVYGVDHPLPFLLIHALIFYLPIRLMQKVGLLAFIVFYFSFELCWMLVGSCDPTTWAGRQGLLALGVLALLALWGFRETVRHQTGGLRTTTNY